MYFTAFALCILRLFKLKTKGQAMTRNPHCKVVELKINQNFWALNNKA